MLKYNPQALEILRERLPEQNAAFDELVRAGTPRESKMDYASLHTLTLLSLFCNWENTPQGHEYWEAVYHAQELLALPKTA